MLYIQSVPGELDKLQRIINFQNVRSCLYVAAYHWFSLTWEISTSRRVVEIRISGRTNRLCPFKSPKMVFILMSNVFLS